MARPSDPNAKIQLLRAAETVFGERGLDQAKVEHITDRAGVSKGSFYLHFENKEDAFRQIVETMLARMASCIEDDLLVERTIPAGAVAARAVLDFWLEKDVEIFEFIWQNRRVVRLMLEGGRSASFAYLIDDFAERCRTHTKQFLEWGRSKGLYDKGLDVELASLLIAGAYDRVARQLVRADRKPNLRELFGSLQRLLVTGLGTEAFRQVADLKVSHQKQQRKARS
jgi:AcrR family transcriptional regulator